MKYKNRFFASCQQVHEEVIDGESFFLRAGSFGSNCDSLSQTVKPNLKNNQESTIDVGKSNLNTVLNGLVDWSLKDEETGEKIPIDKETVQALMGKYGTRILQKLNELNASEEEELGN